MKLIISVIFIICYYAASAWHLPHEETWVRRGLRHKHPGFVGGGSYLGHLHRHRYGNSDSSENDSSDSDSLSAESDEHRRDGRHRHHIKKWREDNWAGENRKHKNANWELEDSDWRSPKIWHSNDYNNDRGFGFGNDDGWRSYGPYDQGWDSDAWRNYRREYDGWRNGAWKNDEFPFINEGWSNDGLNNNGWNNNRWNNDRYNNGWNNDGWENDGWENDGWMNNGWMNNGLNNYELENEGW